jgi:hypothetical protein
MDTGVMAVSLEINYSSELQEAVRETQSEAFRASEARPFHDMAHAAAVREVVAVLADQFAEVLVFSAYSASEEQAEVNKDRSRLILRILPERFADHFGLQRFLRHQLGRLRDILDATFGYGDGVPEGLVLTRQLQRRFCLLWNCSIDGRTARTGGSPMHVREEYGAVFARLFPGLSGKAIENAIGQLWETERPSFGHLMHMAADLAAVAV